jgi:hypothetical protein
MSVTANSTYIIKAQREFNFVRNLEVTSMRQEPERKGKEPKSSCGTPI